MCKLCHYNNHQHIQAKLKNLSPIQYRTQLLEVAYIMSNLITSCFN
ncbi:IS3 family transposase [Lysinibacillus sp. NPDC097279]